MLTIQDSLTVDRQLNAIVFNLQLLNSSRSPLTALTVLKKICDHPRLLKNRQCEQLGMSVGGNGYVPDMFSWILTLHFLSFKLHN